MRAAFVLVTRCAVIILKRLIDGAARRQCSEIQEASRAAWVSGGQQRPVHYYPRACTSGSRALSTRGGGDRFRRLLTSCSATGVLRTDVPPEAGPRPPRALRRRLRSWKHVPIA